MDFIFKSSHSVLLNWDKGIFPVNLLIVYRHTIAKKVTDRCCQIGQNILDCKGVYNGFKSFLRELEYSNFLALFSHFQIVVAWILWYFINIFKRTVPRNYTFRKCFSFVCSTRILLKGTLNCKWWVNKWWLIIKVLIQIFQSHSL